MIVQYKEPFVSNANLPTTNQLLPDVVELMELKAYENANKYLGAGWVLIGTYTWDYGDPVARHQKTVYCLAWLRSAGNPVHPSISQQLEKAII